MKKDRFSLLYRWIRLAQSGITLEKLLLDRKLQKIMLYGYTQIAECILYELKNSAIEVLAVIDKKGSNILIDYPAYKPNEIGSLKFDAIIMMPVDDYRLLKSELSHCTTAEIISIEEVLYEL